MAAYLAEGQSYQLLVKTLTPCVESFPGSNDSTKTFFAHDLLLTNEMGELFPSQICDLNNYFTAAAEGDLIEVKVSTFKKERYSVKLNKVIKKATRTGAVIPGNPIVGGTAALEALRLAVEYYKTNEEYPGEKDVFTTANAYFEWLKNKAS